MANRRLRVLFVTTEAYGGFGGIAVQATDMIDALCDLPYIERVIVLPRLIRHDPGAMPDKVDFRVDAARGGAAFVRAGLAAATNPFDLVISTHLHLLPVARTLAALRRVPLVCVLHGIEAWSRTRRVLVDGAATACDRIVSVSELTAERFAAWAGGDASRVRILPNCVRLEQFGPGEKPPYLVDRYGLAGCRTLLMLGRLASLERQKGVEEMITAMSGLVERHPDLRYVVCGDGDDRPRLEAIARTAGLSHHVIFAGRIPDSEKADHYRLADVYAMVGRQEGFGIVFLEAMACGIPVVASTHDGSREAVLDGRLGELADPDDIASLQAAVSRALTRPRGVPPGLEHFSFGAFTSRLDAIVREVCGVRGGTGG